MHAKLATGGGLARLLKASFLLAGAAITQSALAQQAQDANDLDDDDIEQIEEIVVTGSYIKGTPADAISPVQTLSHQDLIKSGVSDLSETIRNLEIASGSDTAALDTSRFTYGSGSGLANVALRGLGPTSTLVMLDSKRMPFAGQKLNDGDRFVDINQIPITMIDRIEVLKDGGSALYGSDAIAGTVNFITRDDFEGFELTAKTQIVSAGGQTDNTIGTIWGWANDDNTSHLVIGGEFFTRDILFQRERFDLYRDRFPRQDVGSALVVRSTAFGANPLNPAPGCEQAGFIVDNADYTDPAACSWSGSDTFVAIPPLERSSLMLSFKQDFGVGELYLTWSNLDMLSGQSLPTNLGPREPKLFAPSLLGYGHVLAAGAGVAQAAAALRTADRSNQGVALGLLGTAHATALATSPLPWDTQNVQLKILLDQITGPLAAAGLPLAAAGITPQFSSDLQSIGLWQLNPGAPNDPSLQSATGPLPASPIPAALVFTGSPFQAAVPLPLDLVYFSLRAPGLEPTRNFDYTSEQNTGRLQVGFRGQFGSSQVWNYDVSWNSGSSTYQTTNLGQNKDRLELALYGLGGPGCTPNGAIKVEDAFRKGGPALAGIVGAARNYLAGEDGVLDPSLAPGARPGEGKLGVLESVVDLLVGDVVGFPAMNPDNLVLAMTSTNQGTGGCEFYNPYLTRATPAGANNDGLLRWIEADVSYLNDTETSLDVLDFIATTEFDNGISLALGLQNRSEGRTTKVNDLNTGYVNSFGQQTSNESVFALSENTNFSASRNILGLFAEAQIPLADRLQLQVAGRFEDYGGSIGNSFDPKVAVRWEFTDNSILRGSIGSSFRGPSLAQARGGSGYNIEFGVLDPLASRGAQDEVGRAKGLQCVRTGKCDPITDSSVSIFKRGLPSPALDPEKATTMTMGLVLTPNNGPLSLSLDYYRIDFKDKILDVPTQSYLDQELDLFLKAKAANDFVVVDASLPNFRQPCDPNDAQYAPGVAVTGEACQVNPSAYSLGSTITRSPDSTRTLQIVEGPVINTGSVLTSGFDFNVSYQFEYNNGNSLLLDATLTQLLEYKVADLPVGLPDFDAAGSTNRLPTRRITRSIPEQKGHFSATLNMTDHAFLGNLRYIGAYQDNALQVLENEIGPYFSLDFRYTYRLPVNGLEIAVGAVDLLDAELPALRVQPGTDLSTFDTRGQRIYFSVAWRL